MEGERERLVRSNLLFYKATPRYCYALLDNDKIRTPSISVRNNTVLIYSGAISCLRVAGPMQKQHRSQRNHRLNVFFLLVKRLFTYC